MSMTDEQFRIDVAGEEYTLYQLAHIADCADPDSGESEGAQFLRRVASSAGEIIEDYRTEHTPESHWDYSGDILEAADGAPSVYTHSMWDQFVDLAAYNEDPSEFGSECSDMDHLARICLFQIAERLVWELVRAAGPFDADEDEDA